MNKNRIIIICLLALSACGCTCKAQKESAAEECNTRYGIDSTFLKGRGVYLMYEFQNHSGQNLNLLFSKRPYGTIGYTCDIELCTVGAVGVKRLTAFKGKDGISETLTVMVDTTCVSEYSDGWESFEAEYVESMEQLRMPFTKNGIIYGMVAYMFNGEIFEQIFPDPEWQLDFYAEKQYFDVDFDGKEELLVNDFCNSRQGNGYTAYKDGKRLTEFPLNRFDNSAKFYPERKQICILSEDGANDHCKAIFTKVSKPIRPQPLPGLDTAKSWTASQLRDMYCSQSSTHFRLDTLWESHSGRTIIYFNSK